MVSFIILLIARTARIVVRTDRQNDKPSTVTLAAHARRGLIIGGRKERIIKEDKMVVVSLALAGGAAVLAAVVVYICDRPRENLT